MSPDSYIKYRHGEFSTAMMGQPVFVKWGYWMAIVHYRCHRHCHGLENNDRVLRAICEVDEKDWEYFKGIVFDNDKCFVLDADGLWHQKRAEEDYKEDLKKLELYKRRGEAGAAGRWSRNGHKR